MRDLTPGEQAELAAAQVALDQAMAQENVRVAEAQVALDQAQAASAAQEAAAQVTLDEYQLRYSHTLAGQAEAFREAVSETAHAIVQAWRRLLR